MSSLLGDRIYSIHCRASYVAPGPGGFEERDALILFFILSWCNSSYSSFRPSAIHPNSSNRPCFKKVSGAKKLIDSAPPPKIQRRPLTSLLYSMNPSSMVWDDQLFMHGSRAVAILHTSS